MQTTMRKFNKFMSILFYELFSMKNYFLFGSSVHFNNKNIFVYQKELKQILFKKKLVTICGL